MNNFNKKDTTVKTPISDAIVFRNMMLAVFAIATIFFMKNLISRTWTGAITIGICILIFSVLIFLMKKRNTTPRNQQLVLSLSIAFLVFFISLNSGEYYSDDFPLYLSVIALSGLYLVPKYTIIQALLIDVLLLIAYFIHPEKADPLPQYGMCIFLLTTCAFFLYMVIDRGRAYIELGELRAREAEALLEELKKAGYRLQKGCENFVSGISELEGANASLEESLSNLRDGSLSITRGTEEVSDSFSDISHTMHITQEHISSLNAEVQNVESSFDTSRHSMKSMGSEILSLKTTLEATDQVFSTLNTEINAITDLTKQLNKIASNTTTLALNASIEAARAGQMGAGFAVVADKVQLLAEDSNQCAFKIASVVNAMEALIHETTVSLKDSHQAIDGSVQSLSDFENDFHLLTRSFDILYQNIEEQNENIRMVDNNLDALRNKICDMSVSSLDNQNFVSSITSSIGIYKEGIDKVLDNNAEINQLSVSLLEKGVL